MADELNEASFFLDQGLLEEAREILDTVQVVRPGLPREARLRSRMEALEREGGEATEAEVPVHGDERPPGITPIPMRTGSYNLAEELADELTALPDEPAPAPSEDFQYSVEEVFSEFKKGLEKVVNPGDVDTHYDLGIAYKEMGLLDDAIEVFGVARDGCTGQRKEIDCLTMIALLQGMKGEWPEAVAAYREAIAAPQTTAETLVALRYDLGTAYEAAGETGKALFQFLLVARADPAHRDVSDVVKRLAETSRPEDDGSSAPRRPGGPPRPDLSTARKVGYL